jgi:hypothetical protein
MFGTKGYYHLYKTKWNHYSKYIVMPHIIIEMYQSLKIIFTRAIAYD